MAQGEFTPPQGDPQDPTKSVDPTVSDSQAENTTAESAPAAANTPTLPLPTVEVVAEEEKTPKSRRNRILLAVGGGAVALSALLAGVFMMGRTSAKSDAAPEATAPAPETTDTPDTIEITTPDETTEASEDEEVTTTTEEEEATSTSTEVAESTDTTVDTTIVEDATETTTTEAEESTTTTEVPVVSYEYLNKTESELFSMLVEKGYPGQVVADYTYDAGNRDALALAVANDIAAALNTRDYDAYVSMLGFESLEEYDASLFSGNADDSGELVAKYDQLPLFYAPNPESIKWGACVDTGDIVHCSLAVANFAFWRDNDPTSESVQANIEDPTAKYSEAPEGFILPSDTLSQYFKISFELDKNTGKLVTFDLLISDDEQTPDSL